MRKLKKLAAALLSAAMVFTTMAVPVLAEEPDTIASTPTTGSLTIRKQETDSDGAAIKDVRFAIYKIADITQSVTSGVVDTQVTPVEDIPTVDEASFTKGDLEEIAQATTSSEEYNALAAKIKFQETDGDGGLAPTKTAVTNDKGIATFSNVALGIYAVREIAAPTYVVSKSANFIVSIPMTDSTGDKWIYDVTANPKNAVSRGGITLHKAGKTGNYTTTASLAGVEFVLQHKKSDATWEVIEKNDSNGKSLFITDANGTFSVEDLEPGTYRFIEKSLGSNAGYILDAASAYEFEIRIAPSGKSHIWYDTNGDGEKEDQGVDKDNQEKDSLGYTIEVMNEKPTLEKTVKDGATYDNETSASIGELVEWKVEASVPSKIGEMSVYELKDTMSAGLTYEPANADLTVSADKNIDLVENDDYTVVAPKVNTKGGIWTITFTKTGKTKLAKGEATLLTVTFKTRLNEDAKIANDGKAGNLNTAGLLYSNNIVPTNELYPNQPKEPTKETIEDQATVYTFGIGVEKIDGKNESTKLADVTFDLYKYSGSKTSDITESDLADDGKIIPIAEVTSGTVGVYKVDANGSAVLTTDENGNITVNGLEEGKYYLVETKTNEGYNLLKDPVEVELAVTFTTKTTTTTSIDANGKVTTTSVTTDTFTGGTSNNGIIKTTIKNNKGFELPSTGGMGTIIFTFGGIALALAGVMIIMASRKKTA
ncbi:MAG: SpaH/EbpB family LPXTG-anchored major pilin [Eubacteriales bacterium]|nr:SpaH/EbpB family LPXTG-anchored major pilin [Eubacteriales bacterium]